MHYGYFSIKCFMEFLYATKILNFEIDFSVLPYRTPYQTQKTKSAKDKKTTLCAFQLWSRRESNPRPNKEIIDFLHA